MKERLIFHVDVNSAYLSWEAVHQLKNGAPTDIRTIPSIIGGDTSLRKGVVLAKSLPAKRFGIHTGEPVTDALTKCPTLQSFQPNFPLYHKYSKAFITILKKYAPVVEQVSIDEAYLDMSGLHYFYSTPLEAAEKIQTDIRETLGFTVNIGISSNKLLAKMASDFEKPDKIHTLFPSEIEKKMWHLPVRTLFFTGRAAAQKLNQLGIYTIGDLAKSNPDFLKAHLNSQGVTLWNYANGRDNSPVKESPDTPKGYGNSMTLSKDLTSLSEAKPVLLELCETVTKRLREDQVYAPWERACDLPQARETPPKREIPYICDFSRCRLNVRLSARIQPLLRGHKYRYFSFWGLSLAVCWRIWGLFRRLYWGENGKWTIKD